jgi:hypothetical protein
VFPLDGVNGIFAVFEFYCLNPRFGVRITATAKSRILNEVGQETFCLDVGHVLRQNGIDDKIDGITVVTHDPFDLYLESASRDNTFALTRLGSLCEDNMLDEEMTSRARDLVCRLRPDFQLPKVLRQSEDNDGPTSMSSMDLAKRFWFEGAVRGNPLAQIALGDEILFEASESGEADALLLAAVLFGLAAQQGNEQAMGSLKRVLEFDVAFSLNPSPVVQVAEAACRLLLPRPL